MPPPAPPARARWASTTGCVPRSCARPLFRMPGDIAAAGDLRTPHPRAIDTSPGALWDWHCHHAGQLRAAFERARISTILPARPRASTSSTMKAGRSAAAVRRWRGVFIGNQLEVRLKKYPLTILWRALRLVGAFTPLDSGELILRGNYEIEGHYQLYLDDRALRQHYTGCQKRKSDRRVGQTGCLPADILDGARLHLPLEMSTRTALFRQVACRTPHDAAALAAARWQGATLTSSASST